MKTSFIDAFKMADEALRQAVIGLSEVIVHPTYVNVDYADIKVVLEEAGLAHMGVGRAQGSNRVLDAIKQAVASPLIETSISGATRLIMCIKGDETLPLAEVSSYVTMASNLVHENCNIKWSVDINPKYGDTVEVLIIASGFTSNQTRPGELINQIETREVEQAKPEPQEQAPVNRPAFFRNFKNFKK